MHRIASSGLLQTEDYARAVIRGTLPHASAEQVENRVAARMERQELLTREDPPQLWAIMDQAAVRRLVGGRAVLREQLARIREVSALPNVTAQVIPYDAGAHPGMLGTFIVLEFPDPADQSLVYLESMAGGRPQEHCPISDLLGLDKESGHLEYKASLRTHADTGKVYKPPETVSLKRIAAFGKQPRWRHATDRRDR